MPRRAVARPPLRNVRANPMRILIPTVDYPPIEGGIGTVTLEVSRELARAGHEVTVVAPHFPDMHAFDRSEPVRVIRFRGYHTGWLRLLPLAVACRPYLDRADLIVAPNVAYGGLLGWIEGKPYVTFAYAYEFLKFQHVPPLATLLRRIYQRAGLVVAISRFTHDRLVECGIPEHNVATILPGASVTQREPARDAETVCRRLGVTAPRFVLAVGRLIPRKGHETLLNAMPMVVRTIPGVQLAIVGRGPCESALREQARRAGLEGVVVFTGRVADNELAALYGRCDVFALPTGEAAGGQVEGFGLVFTEAHAYGKPVVAGRAGGVEDAVLDGITGTLVEPGDDAALAQAVIDLLADPERARQLGEAGRARVQETLNWTAFTREMMIAWEQRR